MLHLGFFTLHFKSIVLHDEKYIRNQLLFESSNEFLKDKERQIIGFNKRPQI